MTEIKKNLNCVTSVSDAILSVTSYPNITSSSSVADNGPSYVTMVVLSFAIGLLLLISSTGSGVTMTVIYLNKSLHTKANYFIFSLCVSDLISAIFCSPLWLYRRTWGFRLWEWGDFLCKFYWMSDYTTNYITSLQIASFAALRVAAVYRPFFVSKLSKKKTLAYIIILWLVSIGIASPLAVLMGVDFNRNSQSKGSFWPSCSIASLDNCCLDQYYIYIQIVNPILFFFPVIFITICSLSIARAIVVKRRWRERYLSINSAHRISRKMVKSNSVITTSFTALPDVITSSSTVDSLPVVKSNSLPGHAPVTYTTSRDSNYNHERATFTQLTLIVVAFMVGYIPVAVYLMWSTSSPGQDRNSTTDYWFGVISYLCLRFSECLNPVMYNLGSRSLRRASKSLLVKIWNVFRCHKV